MPIKCVCVCVCVCVCARARVQMLTNMANDLDQLLNDLSPRETLPQDRNQQHHDYDTETTEYTTILTTDPTRPPTDTSQRVDQHTPGYTHPITQKGGDQTTDYKNQSGSESSTYKHPFQQECVDRSTDTSTPYNQPSLGYRHPIDKGALGKTTGTSHPFNQQSSGYNHPINHDTIDNAANVNHRFQQKGGGRLLSSDCSHSVIQAGGEPGTGVGHPLNREEGVETAGYSHPVKTVEVDGSGGDTISKKVLLPSASSPAARRLTQTTG